MLALNPILPTVPAGLCVDRVTLNAACLTQLTHQVPTEHAENAGTRQRRQSLRIRQSFRPMG
jgi:hypothetical protein